MATTQKQIFTNPDKFEVINKYMRCQTLECCDKYLNPQSTGGLK